MAGNIDWIEVSFAIPWLRSLYLFADSRPHQRLFRTKVVIKKVKAYKQAKTEEKLKKSMNDNF